MPEQDKHLCSTCLSSRVCYIRRGYDDAVSALKSRFMRTGIFVVQGKAEYDVMHCEEYKEDKEKTDGN